MRNAATQPSKTKEKKKNSVCDAAREADGAALSCAHLGQRLKVGAEEKAWQIAHRHLGRRKALGKLGETRRHCLRRARARLVWRRRGEGGAGERRAEERRAKAPKRTDVRAFATHSSQDFCFLQRAPHAARPLEPRGAATSQQHSTKQFESGAASDARTRQTTDWAG